MGTFLSGPVAVLGASGHVGGFLARRLAELPNEVRVLDRHDNLVETLRDADAVVHLAGTLQPIKGNTYEQANVETVRRTVKALAGSSVKRIAFLSYVGADLASPNDYLRTKGEAESLVAECGRESVVIRSTLIYGPPDDPGPSATPFIAHGAKNSVQNDASPPGRSGRMRCKDARSLNSSAIGATEDDAAHRPGRPGWLKASL